MALKIKAAHAKTTIAFGNSPAPLGEQTPDALVRLAILGHQSQDPSILDLFDGELPPVEELQKQLTDKAKKAVVPNPNPAAAEHKPAGNSNETKP